MKTALWSLGLALGLAACGSDSGADAPTVGASGAGGTASGGQAGAGEEGGTTASGAGGMPTGEEGGSGGAPPGACTSHADCAASPEGPRCDAISGQCAPLPPGHLIGWGDGSASSVELVVLYEPKTKREATDLGFHPTRPNELWVIQREYASSETCTDSISAGCASLEGSVNILFDPGTEAQKSVFKKDPNAWHFMRRPPAFAFGANDTMATCGEERTGNYLDETVDYIGPALFSTDLDIFAKQPPGKNGSHLDMLHETPWCMGIAHEKENVYWAFNGKMGAIDRYDFKKDHGPGNEDHSDGELLRYGKGQFKRLAGVPSHMKFSPDQKSIYIADTGNQRVARLDATSGTQGSNATPNLDGLQVAKLMKDVLIEDLVAPGQLEAPSGLAVTADTLYVSDNATSKLHAFGLDGAPLRSLETNLPPGTLAGITVGPDDKLYLVDKLTSRVYRLDPR